MEELLAEWQAEITLKHSAKTVESYVYLMRRFFEHVNKDKVKKYKRIDLVQFLASLTEKYSASYIKHHIAAMKSFFKWARGDKSPAADIPYPKVRRKKQRTVVTNVARDVMRHLSPFQRYATKNRALIMLLYDTGLRAFELCDLRVSDVDLNRQCLYATGKGGRQKFCVFSDDTTIAIEEWLEERKTVTKCDILFVGIGGKTPGYKHTPSGLRSIMRNMLKRINKSREKEGLEPLSGLSPHDWRRGMATTSQRLGAPTRMAQEQGGWEEMEMVQLYSQEISAEDFRPYFPTRELRTDGQMNLF